MMCIESTYISCVRTCIVSTLRIVQRQLDAWSSGSILVRHLRRLSRTHSDTEVFPTFLLHQVHCIVLLQLIPVMAMSPVQSSPVHDCGLGFWLIWPVCTTHSIFTTSRNKRTNELTDKLPQLPREERRME